VALAEAAEAEAWVKATAFLLGQAVLVALAVVAQVAALMLETAAQAGRVALVVLVVHLVQVALLGVPAQQETPVATATIPTALAALVDLPVHLVVQPVNTFADQATYNLQTTVLCKEAQHNELRHSRN